MKCGVGAVSNNANRVFRREGAYDRFVTAIVKVKCKCKKIALHSVKIYIWSSPEHFKLRAKQFLQN